MLSPKAFLLQECANVRDVLGETLRYKYGADGSKDFYDECLIRLESTEAGVKGCQEGDHDQLALFSKLLQRLTYLIARIERSSIGEYSWPFVEELKDLAVGICSEATLAHDSTPPLIHVLSQGEFGYSIDPEQSRPSASRRKILTIVLPRTLKHFVLLHAILGHEIGHAIYANAKHQQQLKHVRRAHLGKVGNVLESSASTAARMFDQAAPFQVKQYLIRRRMRQDDDLYRYSDWDAWVEEVLCDLIGLVSFGPSYVAAAWHLLLAMDPTGMRWGPNHPPIAWRLNMLLDGASILGMDTVSSGDSKTDAEARDFWEALKSKRYSDPWCDIIDRASLTDALNEIKLLLDAHPPAAYPPKPDGLLPSLLRDLGHLVPPAGFAVGQDDSLLLQQIDFRHILYAGWIHGHSADIDQKILNRLCEHAIMQQRAVKKFQRSTP
ncbi:hypothetical protein [Hydrogenophaga intermedia]|uniref:Uncharacterized protein n=1 Tax=Hydrogenophaga intermedia TaxID=65786 RepID=A0A1L1PUS0_HYDIT|nr:hypothetical protein [Hydrogenophaga intermedia]TMU72087.1 hypothetical protein FGJ01_19745 [Hydrogenophaga intermedia]CDN88381.1 hypothetical protein BN948_02815 [Hydrogenophaga intermedia]